AADAVRLDVLDRGDEPRLPERVGPTAALDLVHPAAAGQLVERGGGLGAEDDAQRGEGEAVGQLEGDEFQAEVVAQHVERGPVERAGRALSLRLEGALQVAHADLPERPRLVPDE